MDKQTWPAMTQAVTPNLVGTLPSYATQQLPQMPGWLTSRHWMIYLLIKEPSSWCCPEVNTEKTDYTISLIDNVQWLSLDNWLLE